MRYLLLSLLLAGLGGASPAHAATFPLPPPGESIVGEVSYDVTSEADTLVDVSRRNRLGYEELILANPNVDRWLPGEGTQIILPTRFILPPGPREGIVVNLAEFRLYYYPKPARPGGKRFVETFAVSAGRDDWKTPVTRATRVSHKLTNPAWYPPKSIREEHKADGDELPAVVPPGPDNPLGPLALKLGIPGGYFIHGTSKPFGIGMKVTHGCLRLYPEDMESLFERVPRGTKVRVIDEPYKSGWRDGRLYVEVHPPIVGEEPPRADLGAVIDRLKLAIAKQPGYEIDWPWVESIALQPRGMPIIVRRREPTRG